MKLYYTSILSLLSLLLTISIPVLAQQQGQRNLGIDPTVEIITDYKGKIMDADKIEMKKNFIDSLLQPQKRFMYAIVTQDLTNRFEIRPIPAADMDIEQMQDLAEHGYVKIGLSYPLIPESNLYLHGPLSERASISVYANHRSFWGQLPIYKDAPAVNKFIPDKILGDNSKTRVGASVQHFWSKMALLVNAEYKHHYLIYYGQDTLLLKENLNNGYPKQIEDNSYMRQHLSQTFNNFNGSVNLYSLNNSDHRLTFTIKAYFDYIKESAKQLITNPMNQSLVGFNTILNFDLYNDHAIGLLIKGETSNRYDAKKFNSGVFNITPFYAFENEQLTFLAGLNVEGIYNSKMSYNFYPEVKISYVAIPGILIPYGEANGGTKINSYSRITDENPYLLPGIDISNTRTRIHALVGITGSVQNYLSYNIKVSYDMIDSMYFFVNSPKKIIDDIPLPGPIRSNFDVRYDNITQLAFGIDLSSKIQNFEGMLHAKYTSYNMDKEDKAWHKPSLELRLQARYKWEQFIFSINALFRDKTPVLLPQHYNINSTETDVYINIGLSAEYRITNRFSVYIKGDNLLSRKNQQYYLYYDVGINIGAGVTCSF
jgi:hypothetical protein